MAEFTKAIPASSLQGSGFGLPPAFHNEVVSTLGKHPFTLKNGEGKTWAVQITRKPQGNFERADIHGGWHRFVVDNGLQAGDEVRFRHLGGAVIEVTKTGRSGPAGRTPGKAAKTPAKAKAAGKTPAKAKAAAKTPGSKGRRASAGGSKTPGSVGGGVAKRRGAGGAAKQATAGTPKSPASGRRGRRSSAGGAAAPRAPVAAEAAEEEQQAGGSWCAIM